MDDHVPFAISLEAATVAPMGAASASVCASVLVILVTGCAHVAPPASLIPSADDALARMHATFACGRATQASAKVDEFGDRGRVRADMLLFTARPARIRMDIVSPFGVALATLTSDGARFALSDLRDKRAFVGPAAACNIARLTTVPVPGHVLVDLLRGEAPVLRHASGATRISWNDRGFYSLVIAGTEGAIEVVHLVPRPDDWGRPWTDQRLRVLDVAVEQQGYILYHAELSAHVRVSTASPRVDPDGLAPPIPPSGPVCDAEIPRRIHVEVPDPAADVRFNYEDVTWNPPLIDGLFEQTSSPGMRVEFVDCP
jgi:hypothetical protein